MAITNAQQYQQLVNPPMKGNKRPGYRGDDAARSSEGTSGGRADPGGAGRGDTRGDPGPVERDTGLERARQRNIETSKTFKEKRPEVKIPNFGLTGMFLNLFNKGINSPIQKFANFTASKNRPFFIDEVVRAGKIPGLNFGTVSNMTEEELEEAYQNYDNARLSGNIDAYGNPLNQGGGEGSNILLPQGIMAQAPSIMDQEPEEEEGLRLAFRAEGGPINGGIMDLESARQELFLGGVADAIGKGLKKVTRGIKKIGKSPIGKAALLYAGVGGLGNLAGGSGLGGMFRGIRNPSSFLGGASNIFKSGGLRNILVGGERTFGNPIKGDIRPFSGIFGSGGELSPLKAIGVTSALSGFLTPEQEDEAQQLADDTGFSIEEARNSILARARDDYKMDFRARGFRAEGGPAEGKEPVAKKTMPLLDMDGKEMDLRAEGGFVPIGRMEKADDVPARLSKNEFVFTADAVRNAGEGDVDKGAEVMYNMMKNLESGGDVSEESQGLDGARKMFQTSQRLEEVL